MRLRSQFFISLIIFAVVTIIIVASLLVTEIKSSELRSKRETASTAETEIADLGNITINYFLYQQDIGVWQSKISLLHDKLSMLSSSDPQEHALLNTVFFDLSVTNETFYNATAVIKKTPVNQSSSGLFAALWSSTARQIGTLSIDMEHLSRWLDTQASIANQMNSILVATMIVLFGAYFLLMYQLVFKRTLSSITRLQYKTQQISNGNLEYPFEKQSNDEIGELSSDVDKMVNNLKHTTASKQELEQEVAERKNAESALKESKERLELAQTVACLGSWEFNIRTGRATWSRELYDIFGLNPKMVAPNIEMYSRMIHPDDLATVSSKMEPLNAKGKLGDTVDLIYRIVWPNGSIRFLRSKRIITEIDDKGKPSKLMGVEQDITEEKQAEQSLMEAQAKLKDYANNLERLVDERANKILESERNYRELYESFGEAFIATNWDLNVIHWNKAAERVTTVPSKDALGKKVYDVLPEMNTVNITPYYEALQKKQSVRFVMNAVSRETKKPAVFEVSIYPSSQGIIIIVIDKTEEEKNRRLSVIGQTAGMVGHDIRNPLQSITNDLYLIKESVNETPECRQHEGIQESLSTIEENISYINKIVGDLQDYTRPLNPQKSEINVAKLVQATLSEVKVPQGIVTTIQVPQGLTMLSDEAYLKRILINLLSNAVQAMPKGGEVTLKVNWAENKVIFNFKDTGVGISKDVRDKIFTPLFTTKAKGQGFGLAVVKRLAEGLGGNISYVSEEGKGTEFTVELPSNT